MQRKLHAFGVLAALCLGMAATAQAQTPTVTITSSKLGGSRPVTGTLTLTPTLTNGTPASVVLSSGGIQTVDLFTAAVTNGVSRIDGVPDTSTSNPQNICYKATLTSRGGKGLGPGFECLQPAHNNSWCSNGVCNLDQVVPNLAAQMPVVQGPTGSKGDPGCQVGSTCDTLAHIALTGDASDLSSGVMSARRVPFAQRNPGYGGSAAGISADGNTGGDTGITESFYGDMLCVPTSSAAGAPYTAPGGFDLATGHACSKQFVYPQSPGTAFQLSRPLQFAGGSQAQTTSGIAQARIAFRPGQNSFAAIGFNAAPASTANTNDALRVVVAATAQGWVLDNQGVRTLFLPNAGTTSGTPGTTDSGSGFGWVAPPADTYDVTIVIPGDGSILVSLVRLGTPANSYAFRFTNQTLPTCAAPCGMVGASAGLQNFEIDGSASADYIANAAYTVGGPRAASYGIPHRSGYYGGAVLYRFPVASNVFFWVPWGYQRNSASKWAVVHHGFNETSQVVQNSYLPVTTMLLQQGYVVASIDNTLQNCYGNAQCMTDVSSGLSTAQSFLSLAPQPYALADSMGGFQMLNAISRGYLRPRAAVGFSINTDLSWAYNSGGASTPINTAYGINGSNPYAVATSGYDPQAVAVGGNSLQLDRLASIPMLLFASPSDSVVSKAQNSDAFATAINQAGGSVTVQTVAGDHLSPDNFRGAQVLAFFSNN